MILHGNQRGGAKDLALHLMKEENERVQIHEMRGFVSDTLEGAFQESYAISKATRCKQHLYSMSINPPSHADIRPEQFVDAADRAEKSLGLVGQPRAIVFHEKLGSDGELRRHAHAVWCRIDAETMKAKQLSYDKEKLRQVSRELHIDHDLRMPPGLINSKERSPRNFTLAEWQQCKRADKDPKKVKEAFQDCWAISDSKAAFQQALEERGYFLAQGRRGHVAVDFKGEKYAVSRYVGIKAKDVRSRLGEADGLPSVEQAQVNAAKQVTDRLKELQNQQQREAERKRQYAAEQKKRMLAQQAREAALLRNAQNKRQQEEENERQARIRRGVLGFMDRLTGKRKQTEQQNQNEAVRAKQRDTKEQTLLQTTQNEAARVQKEKTNADRVQNVKATRELKNDIRELKAATPPPQQQGRSYADEQRAKAEAARQNRQRSRDGPNLER